VLAIVTLSVYFAFSPMGGVWGSSVSSGFNFIRSGFGTRPFVTWHSLTVGQYLLASIGVSLGTVLCFGLMAYAVGLWVRNSYIGFLAVIAINGVVFLLPYYSPFMLFNFAVIQSSPIFLVMLRTLWFTDGGMDVVLPHFETVGIAVALVILMAVGAFSAMRFKRRNLL